MRIFETLNMTSQTVTNMTLAVPLEEQFQCCICLDIYTDPASIPCGHNFCLDCIDGFWDTKSKYECPLCKETFRKRPQLRVNLGYAEIIEIYKRSQGENGDDVSPPGSRKSSLNQLLEAEVPCDLCHGDKSSSVKSCLTCQVSYCEHHLLPHLRDPALQRHPLMDPATFIASHLCRKHNKPLTMFCRKDQKPVCMRCTEREHKNHKTVPIEKESKRVRSRLRETNVSIQQMIQARLTKMAEIKQSVNSSRALTIIMVEKFGADMTKYDEVPTTSCFMANHAIQMIIKDREIQSSVQDCNMLINTIKRHQVELVEELEEKQREAERRAVELFEELDQEVNDLQMRGSELRDLEHTHNPVHLLQSFKSRSRLPSTRDWSDVVVHSDNCMGTVSRAVSKLVDVCQGLANKLSAEDADKLTQYAVDVTLDPETASGWLDLSPDRKKVTVRSQKNNAPLPDNPQRFDACVCILGKQSFTSGRRYWEVEVGDKTDWDLGVARETINRKGAITVRPDSGYWAICRRKGSNLSACAGPSVTLQLQKTPQKVGVLLDYEGGSVSFYDAEAKTHIYTYSGCDFIKALYPYFNPCVPENGKNTAPLIICPLEERQRITFVSTV